MTVTGIQRALDFLEILPRLDNDTRIGALPPRADYDSLAALGSINGYAFAADEIAEAFRIFVTARSLKEPKSAFSPHW
jgi:hypothetical protein